MMIEEKVLQNEIDWQKLNELFAEACRLESSSARNEFLRKISDAGLRRQIERMLKAARKAEEKGFLAENAFSLGAKIISKEEKRAAKRIGKYKILKEIGRGGMGAVFLAEREDFSQQVAVKVIKRGMDTEDIVRRFKREREVLASLNHPFIARLLDGGTTESDLPFFVMEYIEGVPLTEFCDREKLGIEQRLELFRKVCAAVAFAHRNLIVHRDLKPSNILVTKDGEPKLLDFGISKLLGAAGASDAATEQTAAESRLLTPEYASPEQIRGETAVTTVSDIYSLGVLLYELLSGHRPFRLNNRTSPEVLKIISEREPPAPSTAALTSEEIIKGDTKELLSPETIAESRSEKPERLRRRLAGDLDNIVLKSLSKEPARRYPSVEQFSEDLQRHLDGRPVSARRATFAYTADKFVRRNRKSVAFTGFALLLVFLGFSIAVWQAIVAREQRASAEQRFNKVRKLANTLIDGWDKDMPGVAIPFQVRGRLADISAEYLESLAREAGDDPALLRELAEAHIALGHQYAHQFINTRKAESSFREAERIARRLSVVAPQDLQARELLVRSLSKYDEFFGERNREESLLTRLEILRVAEEILAADRGEKTLKLVITAYGDCGWTLKKLGRGEEALVYFRRSSQLSKQRIEILEKSAVPEDRAKLSGALMHLALDQAHELNELPEATENARRAFEIERAVYQEKPEYDTIVTTAYKYGTILKKSNDHARAVEMFRTAVEISRTFYQQNQNPYLKGKEFRGLLEIAESLYEMGETEKAVAAAQESLEIRRKWMELLGDKAAGEQTFRHGVFFHSGGRLFARMGRYDEAVRVFREAEESLLKVLRTSPDKILNRQNLAQLYLTMGDFYGGLGVCGFERFKPYGSIGDNYVYCPPASDNFTGNRGSLQKARNFYQKGVDLLAELDRASSTTTDDQENLRSGRLKIKFITRD